MMNQRTIRSTALLLAALACPAFAAAAEGPQTWVADPVHSTAQFTVTHLGISHVSGTIPIEAASIVTSSSPALPVKVAATLAPGRVDTRNDDRDADLKSPHFFDAAQFPTMTFSSTAIAAVDAKSFTLTGDLTLHGVTKPITLTAAFLGRAVDPKGQERVAYEATGSLSRSAYGITYFPGVVGDDVAIVLDIEAVAKK